LGADKYMGINESHKIAESELIINSDGSIYHLRLLPEHVSKNIIIVGDPARVEMISNKFDRIDFKIFNREFITHTGEFNKTPVTVIGTGIGPDNIDIVLNELDAAVNIDLQSRKIKRDKTSLNIVRIGTSGALQADIPVDSFVLSSHGLGLDNLLHYYQGWEYLSDPEVEGEISRQVFNNTPTINPYLIKATEDLSKKIGAGFLSGITATAPGFYGPQGRTLRLLPALPDLNDKLSAFEYKNLRITNFEMETSALYGLGQLLGHSTCTVCAIIANRMRKEYSRDYKKTVDQLIDIVLERLTGGC
jgi:uridine phosphorylase